MNPTCFLKRKCNYTFILLFVLLFCSVFSAKSTIYYISPSGDDVLGTGALTNPWQTLTKATATVNNQGDIIHVNAGTYIETAQCYLAPGVSIEGEGITSIIKSTLNAQFVPILSLNSAIEGTNGNQHISNIKFNGNNLTTSWAISIAARSNVSIYNCTIVDFFETGVNWAGRSDGIQAPPAIFATGNIFHDNTMSNCATADGLYGRGCFQFGGQDGMLIYNNTITNNSRADGANGWPIKGCNDSYIKNCKIYNNILTSAAFPYVANGYNGYWDFSIELFDNLGGNEIYNNVMNGSLDLNRQSKGSAAFSVWIHDNIIGFPTFQLHRQSGIILEYDTEDAIIEYNTIQNVADGIVFSTRNASAITNTIIQKNLIYNIGAPGGGYGGGINTFTDGSNNYTVNNLKIYNNTFVASGGGDAPFWGVQLSNAASLNLIDFKNNIVTGFNIGGAALVSDVLGNISNSTFQYNNFYNNSNSDDPFPAWASVTTLGAGNNINNNIKTNPLFVSATDYHLQTISPAVDAGINVGLPYTGSAPDMGYIETAGIILPVKLINFTAAKLNNENILRWTTVTESNSNYFSIERSSDGQHFTSIGKIAAAGFSAANIDYSFIDAAPLSAPQYYRLVMIDKDYKKEYSNIVFLDNKENNSLSIGNAQISISKNQASIVVSSPQNQNASISLFDNSGRVYFIEKIQLQKGENNILKTTTLLSNGIYFIKINTIDKQITKRIAASN